MGKDREAVDVRKDMLKSQMWRKSCSGEILLADLVHTLYNMLLFQN